MGISSQNKNDKETPTPDKSTVILLVNLALDTTWRMFIPIIGLTIGGVALDVQLGTKPWLTILGIMLGTSIASLLVWRQIKKSKKK